MSFSAVFFDFDGVLAESTGIKTEAFRELYADAGEAVIEKVLAYHAKHAGISRLVKIRHCHKEYLGVDLTDAEHAELGKRYSEIVERRVVACPWVPGARECLDGLKARGTPMFVVSGTPEEELKRVAAARGMTDYFVEVRGSPPFKPEIIEDLIAGHGVNRGRALMVGDALTDYKAAQATGIGFIGRAHPGQGEPFPEGTETVPDLTGLSI